MKKICFTLLFASSALLFSGCETLDTGSARGSDLTLRNDVDEARRDAAYCRKQLNTLIRSHNLLQQDYSTLAARYTSIQESLAKLQAENQNLSAQVASLQSLLSQEQQARQKSLKNMASTIAKQTASAINAAAESKNSSTKDTSGPAGSGEFYKYKVQPGATLSAIAKAYKVDVSDIRKANRLQNDLIRAGQILYIPKK
jgi:LysM repeat protein